MTALTTDDREQIPVLRLQLVLVYMNVIAVGLLAFHDWNRP